MHRKPRALHGLQELTTTSPCLIAISSWFVWSVNLDANVVRLLLRKLGEMCAQLAQMQARDFLVQLFWQQVDLVLVFRLGLVTVRFLIRLAQLELCKRLIRERVRHHERRVPGGAAKVKQAALSEDDDAMAIWENVLVALRLDVHPRCCLFKQLHLDFVVEVTNVAHDCIVLHLLHMGKRNDVFVASGRDEHVGLRNDILHGSNLETLHAGLERANWVDLGDVYDRSLRLHRLC
mmetsp:Transcript_34009/g.56311  ORF Transcript_34009/g.56311 Transcript_34009/m.56311 type:complete len:234 (-) Transcript_34009:891-1592(-)